MSKMKKPRNLDVRKVLPIGKELKLERSNIGVMRDVYNIYLEEKNTKLTYDDRDLKEVIDELEDQIYNNLPKWEEKAKRIIKKDRKEYILGTTVTSLILLELISSLLNYTIHEVINVNNAEYVLENYAKDIDNDGIKEINTDSLESFDNYIEPTESKVYKYTNPIYQLTTQNRILDNSSLSQAMENENIEVIKVDDEVYSTTGYVSFFTFKKDGYKHLISLPYNFESEEEALEIMGYEIARIDSTITDLDYISTLNVKTLDELPTVYKNKTDGTISTKKPNKILTKIFERK